jgi:glutamine cyclotransferase
MKNSNKLLIFLFLLNLLLLESCGENSEWDDISISSNLTDKKIKIDDTLKIKLSKSSKNLVFEIKSNNQIKKISPLDLSFENNNQYNFLLNNLTLGKKELIIKSSNGEKKVNFTLLNNVAPKIYNYEIINEFSRSKNSYTQGLEFYNDTLYESLGRYGQSKLVKVEFNTGKKLKEIKLPSEYFAEGITILNDKIFQLTWKEKVGFVYDIDNFNRINTFEYKNSIEGWGICNDGNKLYKSDGTDKIWILNPENQKEESYIEIYTNKNKVVGLNELEWIDGKIYANRYLFDGIAIINPKNGAIEGVINLSSLKSRVTQHEKLDVINGIAYNKKRNSIFVTGKMWDKLFEIRIKD